MKTNIIKSVEYKDVEGMVTWCGIFLINGKSLDSFLCNDIYTRLNDIEGSNTYETHLRSLPLTGFGEENLQEILDARNPEERDWAIGESIAEVFLSNHFNIYWPWNHKRDTRNPNASLPGADLIGFELNGKNVRLIVGEVKTSSDKNSPPNTMYGRSGMIHQLDQLVSNLELIYQVFYWLFFRCKGTQFEPYYNSAMASYLNSGKKDVGLFGVLIRDTRPNIKDLQNRGKAISKVIKSPSSCNLLGIYLPCAIIELPNRIRGSIE